MVQTKRSLVLTTCFLSGLASIISFVSLFTEQWVTSDLRFQEQGSQTNSNLNYGLFGGTYSQRYIQSLAADVSITCSYSNNVCAILCSESPEKNQEFLNKLYNKQPINWSIDECAHTKPLTYRQTPDIKLQTDKRTDERKFINAYGHLFTIIFLILSGLIGLVAAGLSLWNTTSNPIEIYFNIFGLYIYNSIAFGSLLISLSIWIIIFCCSLIDNPAFISTLNDQMYSTSVDLGWSYWLNLISLLLYAASIVTLYVRSYLISKEPQHKIEVEENATGDILLF